MTPLQPGERGLALMAPPDKRQEILLALMIDATKNLPRRTRYELRGEFNGPPGNHDSMCWYSNKEMQKIEGWEDFLNEPLEYTWVENGGYFLIGRQTT